jgi:hypothetical protein
MYVITEGGALDNYNNTDILGRYGIKVSNYFSRQMAGNNDNFFWKL